MLLKLLEVLSGERLVCLIIKVFGRQNLIFTFPFDVF
jgi:hypothetical protein